MNDDISIEPRASVKWQFHPHQALTAGFGIHGKMESLTNYYSIVTADDGSTSMPNKSLDFSKARHYIIGYENKLSPNLLLKVEAYYQQLYNIPIENKAGSSYSLINQMEGFTDRALVNEGTGRNVGVEVTLERYFADNYYFLVTASVFDSKYTAMDGVEQEYIIQWQLCWQHIDRKRMESAQQKTKEQSYWHQCENFFTRSSPVYANQPGGIDGAR